MLHAVLRGKLDESTPEPQRLEDALTSTVFGTLVWMEQWDLLARWLLGAAQCCPDGTHAAEHHDAWFWPRMANGVEPDVVLRLGHTLVLVEAKYRADRHDRGAADDESDHPRDQLRRQNLCVTTPPDQRIRYAEAIEEAIRACGFVQAFVVNARKQRALDEYRESAARLPELRLRTWQDLYRLLNAPDCAPARWAADLRSYLIRTGLDPFEGIGRQLAKPQETRWMLGWHALRTAIGFRSAVVGVASRSSSETVLKWRPQPASVSFQQAARRIAGAAHLPSAWRVSGGLDRPRLLGLRAIDVSLLEGARLACLLGWRRPDEPAWKRDGGS